MSNYVRVPDMHSKIVDEGEGLKITMPVKRNWFVIIFLCAWLGGWFMGENSAIDQVLNSDVPLSENLFILFWLIGWTIGGIFAFTSLLWMLIGEEDLFFTYESLTVVKNLFEILKPKKFIITEVKNFRISTRNKMFDNKLNFSSLSSGKFGIIAFDYGAKTIKLGTSIDEAEARMLIEKIRSRYPHLVQK